MDASGKFPSGLASGNLADLGSFDQCLGGSTHASHYCTMLLSPKNESLFRNMAIYKHQVEFNFASLLIGVCAPVECQPNQLQTVYQTAFNDWFNASIDSCQAAWSPLHPLQEAALLLIGCWLLLVMLVTFLLGPRSSPAKITPTCVTLATFKTLAILWVLLGHTYAIVEPHVVGLSLRFYEMRTGLAFCAVSNAHVSVEIFFCVTGILIARKKISRRLLSVVCGIVTRYVRLTLPAMATLLLAPLFPIACNGPASLLIMKQRFLDCPRNWWAIPTHVNNFRPMHEKCLPHLWYLSVDLQIFLLVWPLHVLIASKRHRMVLMAAVGVISIVYVTLETLVYNYAPCVMAGRNMHEIWRTSNEVYQRPTAHVASVAVGYLCGCLCGSKMLASQKLAQARAELMILAIAFMTYAVFGGHPWISGAWDHTLRPLYPAVYAGFHRPLFALGIAIIYLIRQHPREVTNASKHGVTSEVKNLFPRFKGAVDPARVVSIASSANTEPVVQSRSFIAFVSSALSRLAFSIYLTHILVVMCSSATARERLVLSHREFLRRYVMHVLLSLIVACIFRAGVETPIQRVLRFYLGNNVVWRCK